MEVSDPAILSAGEAGMPECVDALSFSGLSLIKRAQSALRLAVDPLKMKSCKKNDYPAAVAIQHFSGCSRITEAQPKTELLAGKLQERLLTSAPAGIGQEGSR